MPDYRVALIHNIMTPYRTVLFDTLASHPAIDLHVYYCAESHENRNWSTPDPAHEFTILRGLSIDIGRVHYHANPTVISSLLRGSFDAIVVGGSTNLTMQLGYVASKLTSTGTVLWTERFRETTNPLGKPLIPLLRIMARRADSLLVPTAQAREFQHRRGVEDSRLFVAPNVVDNDVYWSNDRTDEIVKLLFIGQLIDRKGIPYLLDAYAGLKQEDVSLTLVGDGPERERYERDVAARGLDVSFRGWVSEEEKRRCLADADCFVLPSVEDLAPLVLNEAMAAGLPVVTTDGVGNAPEMVTDGENGYIVPACNANALSLAIKRIIDMADDLPQMGTLSSRIAAERFSPAYTAEQFVAAIRNTLI